MIDLKSHINITVQNLNKLINKLKNKQIDLSKLENYINNNSFDKKVFIIGGAQISGSYSPFIHTFSSLELNSKLHFLYFLFNMELNPNLKVNDILNYIEQDEKILGANVTMPYKLEVFDILKKQNKLDNSALLVGAVNTISKQNNKIIGYNTDYLGILLSITNKLKNINNIKYGYILGTGGAAQAAISTLLSLGITNIIIFGRTNPIKLINHFKSKKIKVLLNLNTSINICFEEYDIIKNNNISQCINKKGILINTLPFAFKQNLPTRPIITSEFEKIKDKIDLYFDVVYDLNYGDTPLLQDFKKQNIPTCDGVDMLIGQALRGFELWTNGGKINQEFIKEILKN